MRAPCGGINTRRIEETPFAMIDFETTGLTPGFDRVIEIAVVKLEPGHEPRRLFETLVNPHRSVAAIA
jgi:DNA polymerase III epsilon subunit-like protein